MSPFFYLPPTPPAVVFDEPVCTGARRTVSSEMVSSACILTYGGIAVAVPTIEAKQVQIADGALLSFNWNDLIPMRAANPSLGKKIRTERMSRLEREYRW